MAHKVLEMHIFQPLAHHVHKIQNLSRTMVTEPTNCTTYLYVLCGLLFKTVMYH